jgi:hypothetical protein
MRYFQPNPKRKIKFVLHPGVGAGRRAGDQGHIDAPELARLYGVDIKQCLVFKPGQIGNDHLWHLYPREDGQYLYPGTGMKKQYKPFLK